MIILHESQLRIPKQVPLFVVPQLVTRALRLKTVVPIITVDERFNVLEGAYRLHAARLAGVELIPCKVRHGKGKSQMQHPRLHSTVRKAV